MVWNTGGGDGSFVFMTDKRLTNIVDVHESCDAHFMSLKGCCCHKQDRKECRWVFCKNCKECTINCECGNYEPEVRDNDGNEIKREL